MADGQRVKASGTDLKPRVFRVRNLPEHVDRLSAVELLCQSIDGVAAGDVCLSSLAFDVDVWSWLRTKTATITLQMRGQSGLTKVLSSGEETIPVSGLAKPLIIDSHFQGVTPLNHVPDDVHKYDCLIISGLGSHPFGSWQTHGQDKSFMWIRDELPQRLPGVRFLAYGYDTTIGDSTSFQIIPDLAISLVNTVKSIGWSTPSAKPVLFLAHSLGGVILKQVLAILAGGQSQEWSILTNIKGAIFFGVPSQGMSISDILEMLGDQPNNGLVKDLSNDSDILPSLDEQFGNISYLRRLQFFWAYETKVTPRVEKDFTTGRFARTGPGTVMVSRESATRNFCYLQPSLTIQIDENHSDMVKFGAGNKYIGVIASKLKFICAMPENTASQLAPEHTRKLDQHALAVPTATPNRTQNIGKLPSQRRSDPQPERVIPGFWDCNTILKSLRAPERDRRLEQISQKLGDTFNWAYDDPSTGLSEWLRKGTGIFWIHGKPGSGKSTLMKYLFQDPRTEELLRTGGWRSRARLTTASFFFHHRGTGLEKSFEGLLRSLSSQILEQHESLSALLYPILEKKYRTLIASEDLTSFEEDVWTLLNGLGIPYSSEATAKVEEIVASQVKMTQARRLGTHLRLMLKDVGFKIISQSKDPYDERDFDDYEIMSRTATDIHPDQQAEAKAQPPEAKSWAAVLGSTLKRHYHRERLKAEIPWSRASLEDCLRRLIGQSLFKMDLFLCLDALDEYDGRPEFIASFLQELVRRPAEISKQSLTDVRILFSSRPWKVINDEFAACPGFQIHDHTGNDIFEFCVATIPSEHTASHLLAPFATQIVRRARGVFLWVELVMRDLAKIVLRELHDTQVMEQELRKTLDAIPDELDDYYRLILQRIPLGNRWESYVLLETICRSLHMQDVETGTLLGVLKCSSAKSVADAKRRISQKPQMALQGSSLASGKHYIETVSGGLVETSGRSDRGEPTWQFMHQTVKQFVEGSWFKFQLLGNTIGMFSTENGHSFIAKHSFVDGDFGDRFFYHARQAEVTTGYSQYDFFSTAPPYHYSVAICGMGVKIGRSWDKRVSPAQAPYRLSSIVELSVLAGLQLCVRDYCEAHPSCIRDDSTNLVRILSDAASRSDLGADMSSSINMAELLVSKGLSISEFDNGFLSIVEHMWNTEDDFQPSLESLALNLLDAIDFTGSPSEASSSQSMQARSTIIPSPRLAARLLHQATPKLLRALLARGACPNNLDHNGDTPMDIFVVLDSRLTLQERYDIVSRLACHGGLLRSTPGYRWKAFETMCATSGFDTSVFGKVGFPLWYSENKTARKNISLRVYLSQLFRW